ncbi:MAG: phosphoadenylyl-sulfate reductase [Ilumatobacteraceae bacterium]
MSSPTFPSTLATATPAEIVRWADREFGTDGLTVTASFSDAVLVHVAATAVPGIEITVLDTQYLFAETRWMIDELTRRLDLNLRVVHPSADVRPDNRWQTDIEGCCQARKVEPLQRALAGKRAWLTGVRRADGPTRATAPVAAFDVGRGLVKVNPLAMFSDDDMVLYLRLHDLPSHPLADKGYESIGCWPCTRPVAPGEDKRAGRWSGAVKTECGLHA